MQRARPDLRRQRGAALLMLLLLVVLGGAASLMYAFGGASQEDMRQRRTQQALADAREALLGFAAVNGRLPRPARSALDGHEGLPCPTDSACTGYLPWITLGVSGVDSWGKLLRYSVAPTLTARQTLEHRAVADRRLLWRDSSGAVQAAGPALCSIDTPCLAALLLSHGRNNLGTSAQGLALANAGLANVDEQHNNSAVSAFFSRPATSSAQEPGGEFDDQVLELKLPQLYLRMGATGALP